MRSLTLAFLTLIAVSTQTRAFVLEEGPQTCNANPECAARGLADNCCPTSLAGIYLYCCDDPQPTCDANPGCRGLTDDCCPTKDGVFLYCCFEDGAHGYRFGNHFFAGDNTKNDGEYWLSNGKGRRVPDRLTYEYTRDSDSLYDLIYFRGTTPDASSYVSGAKKFSINIVKTSAPPCTQVMLQFDSTVLGTPDNYPKGRHSRFLGTISANQERIEFDFLDRPDESMVDSDVDAVALLFAPGTLTGDTFEFSDLNSNHRCSGGEEGCEAGPPKSCEAKYLEVQTRSQSSSGDGFLEEGGMEQYTNASKRFLFEEGDDECSDCEDPACMGVGDCSFASSYQTLSRDPSFAEAATVTSGNGSVGSLLALVVAASVALFVF